VCVFYGMLFSVMGNAKLKFGKANSKLKKLEDKKLVKLITFTLPSGHTCPGAKDCLSKADKVTGKLKDGKHRGRRIPKEFWVSGMERGV